jgi:hypothetical protein
VREAECRAQCEPGARHALLADQPRHAHNPLDTIEVKNFIAPTVVVDTSEQVAGDAH